MNIKKIMPLFAIAMGLVLVVATSGFKAHPEKSNTLTFYKYMGPDFSEANITDINQYAQTSNVCSGKLNVCGVYLSTDNGPDNQPDATEFSAESLDLWSSQQNQKSSDPLVIIMKN